MNDIYDHRGGPDREDFDERYPTLRLPAPDVRWSASPHISKKAWSDKYVFNGKSDDTRRWLDKRGGLGVGDVLVTNFVPMLHPFFGTQLRIRCGCKDMVISVKAYPLKCSEERVGPRWVIDRDAAVDMLPDVSLDIAQEAYYHLRPPIPGDVSVQNWAIGVEIISVPEGGIFGDCCNRGCCPHFEIVTMGHEPCFQDDFQGDCTAGRCSTTWTPPEKCVVASNCGNVCAVAVVDAPVAPMIEGSIVADAKDPLPDEPAPDPDPVP